jgi:hypothetical protein
MVIYMDSKGLSSDVIYGERTICVSWEAARKGWEPPTLAKRLFPTVSFNDVTVR